jgi:transposase
MRTYVRSKPRIERVDKESLEQLLARGVSVEKIAKQFGKDPSTVSYWMKKYGLDAPNREKHAARGGIEHELLERLVNDGMTIVEIAAKLDLGKSTVRHWLRRYGLRTAGSRRIETKRAAKDEGLAVIEAACPAHGVTAFAVEGRGYYRCKRCRAERVSNWRRKLKEMLVEEAGGRCCICGYNRYLGALQFHHIDPDNKVLTISRNGVTQSIRALRREARKCALLCSNCHAEVEGGLVALPARVVVAASTDRDRVHQ